MTTALIRLPIERADQLKQLAKHKNITMTDLIGELATAEISRLDLSKHVGLGATIEACICEDDEVHFSAADIGTFRWSRDVTRGVATALDRLASGKTSTLDMDAGLEFKRVGTSIKVRNSTTGDERTFAPSVAVDLARLLQDAASSTI